MTPERRFAVLLACALAALSAFGAGGARIWNAPAAGTPAAVTAADHRHDSDPSPASDVPSLRTHPFLASLSDTTPFERTPEAFAFARPEPSVLEGRQIISYYGNPYTASMGILGAGDLEEVASRLERHAALYDELNGDLGVVPAMHLVYGVAQYHATKNGLFLQYVDDADVERYVELTRDRGMLLFIDLQIGRSSVADEFEKALPYLRHPHVHLALDPEFAVRGSEVPGEDLGALTAAEIDAAQRALELLVEQEQLPRKVLIVHQFADSMLEDGEAIQRYPNVELIIDMDGFGPAAIKRVKYQDIARRSYATQAGIKLFYEHDPDLMSEEDVLRLQPTPVLVIYQ